MPIYWSMLFVTLIIGGITCFAPNKVLTRGKKRLCDTRCLYAIITFAYIVFFCGMRDKVLDTTAYISTFINIPKNFDGIFSFVSKLDTGVGFWFISGIFKMIVSDNHYVWLIIIATVSCFCIARVFYKYSINFPLTAYLFVATTEFAWLINGTRQFLAVCILFTFSDWLLEGKKIRYIIMVCLVATIHSSAIFMIPIIFFVSCRDILGKKMLVFSLITIIGTYYSESLFALLTNEILDESYALSSSNGSNILRLLVALVPTVIMLLCLKTVRKKATPDIVLAANMSFVGACFYFASTFTNGILIGRMPIYYTIYNLYLLPWLIKQCFSKKARILVTVCCVVMYVIYFYYQMEIAWSGLEYSSEILRIDYR